MFLCWGGRAVWGLRRFGLGSSLLGRRLGGLLGWSFSWEVVVVIDG